MNLEALNKTIDLMKKPAAESGVGFHLSAWIAGALADFHEFDPSVILVAEECGTAACIAGYVVLANDGRRGGSIGNEAERILDIGDVDGGNLFTPRIMGKAYDEVTKEDAIKVLEHYRDTGVVDWNIIGKPDWNAA